LITAVMSTVIDAKRDRVWRALTVPEELVGWDEQLISLVDASEQYPRVGEKVRWRYRLGGVAMIRTDRPTEVEPCERLRASITVGPVRFDETYTLDPESEMPGRTRLTLKLSARNEAPMLGGETIDRFDVRRMATELIDSRLRSVQKWCQEQP
jgi:uncharacterized protein YndB with AHSA1/START domain